MFLLCAQECLFCLLIPDELKLKKKTSKKRKKENKKARNWRWPWVTRFNFVHWVITGSCHFMMESKSSSEMFTSGGDSKMW